MPCGAGRGRNRSVSKYECTYALGSGYTWQGGPVPLCRVTEVKYFGFSWSPPVKLQCGGACRQFFAAPPAARLRQSLCSTRAQVRIHPCIYSTPSLPSDERLSFSAAVFSTSAVAPVNNAPTLHQQMAGDMADEHHHEPHMVPFESSFFVPAVPLPRAFALSTAFPSRFGTILPAVRSHTWC